MLNPMSNYISMSSLRSSSLPKEVWCPYDKYGKANKGNRVARLKKGNLRALPRYRESIQNSDDDMKLTMDLLSLTVYDFSRFPVFFTWRPERFTRTEPNSQHVFASYLPFEFRISPDGDQIKVDTIGHIYKFGGHLSRKKGLTLRGRKIFELIILKHAPRPKRVRLDIIDNAVLKRLLVFE